MSPAERLLVEQTAMNQARATAAHAKWEHDLAEQNAHTYADMLERPLRFHPLVFRGIFDPAVPPLSGSEQFRLLWVNQERVNDAAFLRLLGIRPE